MKLNVVIVSESADAKGGASAVAMRSAAILAQGGCRVHVFAGIGPYAGPESERLTAQTLTNGQDLVKAPPHQRAILSLWNAPAATALASTLDVLNPQRTVVHVHSFQHQLTGSVVRRAADLGFPLIYTAHDYGLACPYSGLYDYNTGGPCGERGLSLGCAMRLCNESKSRPGKLWHVAKGLVQRGPGRAPSGFHRFVFVSEFSRRILLPYLPPNAKTVIVPNPVELPNASPRTAAPDAPFLFVGRLTREKDPHTFLAATRKAGVRARVVGSGSAEDELRAAYPEAEFAGWRDAEGVRSEMRQARALVFPSRWYEGEPLTVQEARATGLPVVASDVCAASASVRDGENGYLFPAGDADALADRLRRLDAPLADQMGAAAHADYWRDPPTPAKHLALTRALYEEVLAER